jgi:serine phosphatase RsbU (regulator of sigma subunit)
LYTQHDGKVSAELHIVSIDLVSETIVISRNSHCPPIVGDSAGLRLITESSSAIGVHRRMKPVITEIPLAPQTTVVVFTDGVLDAGVRHGQSFDVARFVEDNLRDPTISAQQLADAILARANELDRGRPGDDTSILVIRIVPRASQDQARRMSVRFPIE